MNEISGFSEVSVKECRLSELSNVEDVKECGISSVRVDLMFEDNESADIVLKNAVRAFVGNEKAEMNGNFTKGHFFRGVE